MRSRFAFARRLEVHSRDRNYLVAGTDFTRPVPGDTFVAP
jgi:hypothetical protein